MTVETTELRPGYEISRVIKGGWQLAGDHGYVDRAQSVRDMEAFLDAGITTFDCADIYVGVEEMIGDFIAEVRARRGADVAGRACVHTKLVPDLGLLETATPDDIEAVIDRSLTRLRVERLHLVQYYWWDLSLGNPMVGIETLMRCQQKGKVAHIGVTNWDVAETQPFLDAGCDLVSTQVQYSLLDRRPENGLTDWAAANGLRLLCYGTLAGGFLTEYWLGQPDPGFAFENRSLIKYRLIIDEMGPWAAFQDLLRHLKSIGDKHGVSLSSVASRWVLEQPQVGAAIVGARTARHLRATLETFAFALDEDDRAAIQSFLDRVSGPKGAVFALERDRTGRHGSIMKYNLNTRPDDKVLGSG
ncbi:MAG: aldo/keto reductase [Pseudomonadota bacterium]